jgi:hypothetical protein
VFLAWIGGAVPPTTASGFVATGRGDFSCAANQSEGGSLDAKPHCRQQRMDVHVLAGRAAML